jgi:hypothetical protein
LHSWDDPRFIRQAKTHSWNKERQTWLGRDCGKWVWGSPVCGGVEALDGHQHLGWIPGIMQFRNSEIDRRRKIQFFFVFFLFFWWEIHVGVQCKSVCSGFGWSHLLR